MKTDIRVVSPYRPFEPESTSHRKLGPFDWVEALRMLATSVTRAMHCETLAITDVDTLLPVPSLHFITTERRLMLWILDVCGAYLQSDAFDRDTILLSPDLLVYGDLRKWMTGDFLVLMRRRFPGHPILNGVQFWPVAMKAQLSAFYAEALEIGRTLPEGYLRWGGDTEPLRQLLAPIVEGPVIRNGRRIARLIESEELLQSLTNSMETALSCGVVVPPTKPIMDFRYLRKRWMRTYFAATIGLTVAA